MIYSIGYQSLTPDELAAAVRKLKIDCLVDVRAKPWSRKAGFNQHALQRLLGFRYVWKGDVLGGPGGGGSIKPSGIAWLRRALETHPDQRLMLMCLEHDPEDCHRHDIALKLLPDIEVVHVFEGEGIRTRELERAIRAKDYAATIAL